MKNEWLAVLALTASVGAANAAAPFSAAVMSDESASIWRAFGGSEDQFHPGVDIASAVGAEVHAPADARVMRVHAPGALNGYRGQIVELDHGAAGRTRYSNLDGVALSAGDSVRAGDVIGRVAAPADGAQPHVHVELWRGERLYDPAQELVLTASR